VAGDTELPDQTHHSTAKYNINIINNRPHFQHKANRIYLIKVSEEKSVAKGANPVELTL
jgi:hypothetical protein